MMLFFRKKVIFFHILHTKIGFEKINELAKLVVNFLIFDYA